MSHDPCICVCWHDVHAHEDAEGGTHECITHGCDCQQFLDVDDAETSEPQAES